MTTNTTAKTTDESTAGNWPLRLAARHDRAAHDVFDLVGWVSTVGIARYLWTDTGQTVFAILHWFLSATLFGFLTARLLLRSNISLFSQPDTRWKKTADLMVNFLVCIVAFILTLWFVEQLTDAFAARKGQ